MSTIVGTGDFKYRVIENWAKLPDDWSFKEVAAVGVDNNDNVYIGTVSWPLWPQICDTEPRPADLRSLRKLEPVQ